MPPAPTQTNRQNFLGRETFASGRIIDRYRDITIVQDPNIDVLNDDVRLALLAELRAQAAPRPANLDLDAVNERLRDASDRPDRTSPPSDTSTLTATPETPNTVLRFHVELEKKYRADLTEDGCPVCHPPEYFYPFTTEERIPHQYPAAMYYLEVSGVPDPVPVYAQMLEWISFRGFQEGKRKTFQQHRDPEHKLRQWMESGRTMLRKHGYPEAASLIDWSFDFKSQPRLQSWIEFQVWHLCVLRTEKSRIRGGYTYIGPYQVKLHEDLLVWIEEQRVILASTPEEEQRVASDAAQGEEEGANTASAEPPVRHGSSHGGADDTAVASALAERRRSRRILARTNAATTVQRPTSPSTRKTTAAKTPSKTRNKNRVAKQPALPRSLRPAQHKGQRQDPRRPQGSRELQTPPAAAKTQDGKPRPRGVGHKTAAPSQAHSGKHRVAKAARQRQRQQQHQAAAAPPVFTRSGRLIRTPDRLGVP